MFQYLKTGVAAAARSAAMEAVNHSKNSAVDAGTTSKHGAGSKSLTSRGNFLNVLYLSLLAAVFIFSGCDKDKDKDNDNGNEYLVTEISEENEYRLLRTSFEYDDQNRITKIIDYRERFDYDEIDTRSTTLNYNSAGDLISFAEENGDVTTFTKVGNIITVKQPWWNEDDGSSEKIELNSDGLPVKIIYERDDRADYIALLHWQGGNVSSLVQTGYDKDGYETYSYTLTFKYDDKKNPFWYCKTQEWLLLYFMSDLEWGHKNNIVSISGDENTYTLEYTYNEEGFPVTMKGGYNDDDTVIRYKYEKNEV